MQVGLLTDWPGHPAQFVSRVSQAVWAQPKVKQLRPWAGLGLLAESGHLGQPEQVLGIRPPHLTFVERLPVPGLRCVGEAHPVRICLAGSARRIIGIVSALLGRADDAELCKMGLLGDGFVFRALAGFAYSAPGFRFADFGSGAQERRVFAEALVQLVEHIPSRRNLADRLGPPVGYLEVLFPFFAGLGVPSLRACRFGFPGRTVLAVRVRAGCRLE